MASPVRSGQHGAGLGWSRPLAPAAQGRCDAQRLPRLMIALIGLCLLCMTLFHWLLEPLERTLTALLEMQGLGWMVVGALIWIFASQPAGGSER